MNEKKRIRRRDRYRYKKGNILSKYGQGQKEITIIERPKGVNKAEWAELSKSIVLYLNMHNSVNADFEKQNRRLKNRLNRELKTTGRLAISCTVLASGWILSFLVLSVYLR